MEYRKRRYKCFSHGIGFKNFVLSGLGFFIALLGFASGAIAAAEIELEPVITGLDRPVAITHAGDGSGRLFITLLGGQILILILPQEICINLNLLSNDA